MANNCKWEIIFNQLAREINVSELLADQKSSLKSIMEDGRDLFHACIQSGDRGSGPP